MITDTKPEPHPIKGAAARELDALIRSKARKWDMTYVEAAERLMDEKPHLFGWYRKQAKGGR